jgi:protein phosphatase
MRLVSWSATDTGRKRDHNEDSFLADEELGLFAVADGMGGHQGGGHASKLALDVMRREVRRAGRDFANAASVIAMSVRPRKKIGRSTEPMESMVNDPTMDGDLVEVDPKAQVVVRGPNVKSDEQTAPIEDPLPAAERVMASAARLAGQEIYEAAQDDSNLQGMGTTLTAIVHHDGKMHYAHAGDSRIYLFRDGKLRQLTDDHSWIWEQIKAGAMTEAEAKTSKFRHIITRSVGFERDISVDTGAVDVQAGDCFLLCSDGLSNYVETQELERILATTWFRRAPQLLIDLANDRGGDDNITVVVVFAANDAG